MVFYEQIDRLKKQYTDKYVVVDESRPELRRFAGQTGVVKTVNMSGRALVQFDAFNNTGWYDIDPLYLKVIDAPLPKPEVTKEKAAPAKAEKPPAAAATKAPPKAGGSVADILAAARGGSKAAPSSASPPSAAGSAPKAKSVADILAAARGKAAAPAAETPKAPEPAAEVAPVAAEATPVSEEPAVPEAPEPVVAAAAPAADAGGKLSKKDQITGVAAMVAYCRATDVG